MWLGSRTTESTRRVLFAGFVVFWQRIEEEEKKPTNLHLCTYNIVCCGRRNSDIFTSNWNQTKAKQNSKINFNNQQPASIWKWFITPLDDENCDLFNSVLCAALGFRVCRHCHLLRWSWFSSPSFHVVPFNPSRSFRCQVFISLLLLWFVYLVGAGRAAWWNKVVTIQALSWN